MAGRITKAGRPLTSSKSKAGEYIGFRSPKDLKEKLEQAAQASGRSLSTEVQFRLERSFLDNDIAETLGAVLRRHGVIPKSEAQ